MQTILFFPPKIQSLLSTTAAAIPARAVGIGARPDQLLVCGL
jgi:hypothetical protein